MALLSFAMAARFAELSVDELLCLIEEKTLAMNITQNYDHQKLTEKLTDSDLTKCQCFFGI